MRSGAYKKSANRLKAVGSNLSFATGLGDYMNNDWLVCRNGALSGLIS